VRLTLVKTYLPRRQWNEAGRELIALRAGLGENRAIVDRDLALDADVPLTLLKAGQPSEAVEAAASSHRYLVTTRGATHPDTVLMHAVRGLALGATGRQAEALQSLREALPTLLAAEHQQGGNVPTGLGAGWRLPVILEAYVDLLAQVAGTPVERQAGLAAASEAFRVADLARAGSVQRALTANAARAASKDPDLAELVRQEQDAQEQLLALLGALADTTLARPADGQDRKKAEAERAERLRDLKRQIEDLTRARSSLRSEIKRRFPTYESLVNPQPVSVEDTRAALRPGEALVAVLSGDERTYVWAISHQGPVAFTAARIGRRELEGAIARLRTGVVPTGGTADDLPVFDVTGAHALYRALLEPVASAWTGVRLLIVVPHGPLGALPFSALVTAAPPDTIGAGAANFAAYRRVAWLVRGHAVTTAPSVASLVSLRRLPPGNPARQPFIGFGDPVFSARRPAESGRAQTDAVTRGLERFSVRSIGIQGAGGVGSLAEQLAALAPLPETADELRAIATSLGADVSRDVLLGRDANEERVKQADLANRRVVAFATHALVTGEIDGLDEPALALSVPAVAGVQGDGLLTLGEILRLRMDADWVVLSACNTAAGVGESGEAASGLGRAFFYAGTRALLVTHWAVESTSTALLTTRIFSAQQQDPSLTRAEALRQAQLSLIDEGRLSAARSGQPGPSLAHPLFWAPFALVGDGG
jgi:CHAT domain-containing protein